ncbi:MAG TPA: hypothetical protein PLS49_09950, partial [Candidatus Woesebacteria bacterium]|nr:hypothetical protein [Candidatus Woesebacteria bacterium]
VMIYFVGKEYVNEKVGLLAAVMLAISPWHVHFSRVGFQLIASVFWLLFTLYFIHKSFSKTKYVVLAMLGLLLTFFSYSTTKMYLPFLIILHIFVYPKEWIKLYKNKFVIGVTIFSIVFLSLLLKPYLENGTFFQRWVQVDKKLSVEQVIQAYRNHFSLDFLFITGDADFKNQQVKRHSIHGVGELYWFQLVFLAISFVYFLISKKERMKLLFWFLFLYIYPLGSIFTSVEPQATRSILGVIPFTVLTAYGIYKSVDLFKTAILKKLYIVVLSVVILVSTFLFIVALRNYPLTGAHYWGWQYGYRQALAYVSDRRPLYKQIIITHRFNRGMALLDFYNKEYNCNECVISSNPIEIDINKKQLFVLRLEDIKEAATLYPELQFINQQTIRLPNGNAELFIGEFIQHDLFF